MSLFDSSGPLEDQVDVIEQTAHTFTCRVEGTKPAATIKWYLDDVEQTAATTTPGVGNGLVDTESHWTFTPQRVNHRNTVKCEANTVESVGQFPSISTALIVIGEYNLNINLTFDLALHHADMIDKKYVFWF